MFCEMWELTAQEIAVPWMGWARAAAVHVSHILLFASLPHSFSGGTTSQDSVSQASQQRLPDSAKDTLVGFVVGTSQELDWYQWSTFNRGHQTSVKWQRFWAHYWAGLGLNQRPGPSCVAPSYSTFSDFLHLRKGDKKTRVSEFCYKVLTNKVYLLKQSD